MNGGRSQVHVGGTDGLMPSTQPISHTYLALGKVADGWTAMQYRKLSYVANLPPISATCLVWTTLWLTHCPLVQCPGHLMWPTPDQIAASLHSTTTRDKIAASLHFTRERIAASLHSTRNLIAASLHSTWDRITASLHSTRDQKLLACTPHGT
jgi:hypothetical protein